jgi:uncharacterized heparinase superfamily protein
MTSRKPVAATIRRAMGMDRAELAWRGRAALRIAAGRAGAAIRHPQWRRRDLSRAISGGPEFRNLRRLAEHGEWQRLHRELATAFATDPPRFVVAPALRAATAARISARFPDSAREAGATANRIVAGDYDLLGYRGLRFPSPSGVDWHYDPVHDRRAPLTFWSTVPYLSPSCGDHKVIWELNRHQHWVALGRAYWLTGDARYRARVLMELASWLEANPPLMGINWSSMLELGFRSMSWLWTVNLLADPAAADADPWLVDLLLALDRQLTHIEQNLSYYFSPNTHLLGEALALYVCGRALPLLKASDRRAAVGRRVLLAEMDRQIAPDGGHSERSTHYHRYALDFYLLALAVARITNDPSAAAFERAAARLGFAARLLADDRGVLPHIGDDDGGTTFALTGRAVDDIRDSLATTAAMVGRFDLNVAGPQEESHWVLAHPVLVPALEALEAAPPAEPIGSAPLPDTGYYVSRSSAGDHLVADAGPHGYQNAGHAHADALSLTLSVRGVPLLIDPGTSCYTIDAPLRDRMRSTSAHNTLMLDGQPQSVPSGPFHWSRAAQAAAHCWRANAGFDYLEATHDGYLPLVHRRHLLALHGDLLVVADLVEGDGLHRADVHWHIDPRWQVSAEQRRAVLAFPGERVDLAVTHGVLQTFCGDRATGLGWTAPVYGREERATTIRVSHTGGAPMWIVSVFGFNRANAIADVETIPVWAEAGALGQSVAVRISRESSVDLFALVHPNRHGHARGGGSADRGPADTGSSEGSRWRVGEIETDAHLLFYRSDAKGVPSRIALVDGSFVGIAARRRFVLALPREVPDLHLDLAVPDEAAVSEARLSGPAFGARIELGGQEVPIAIERRSTARLRVPRREVR